MAERFLQLKEVLRRTSLSRAHTYRLIKVGTHPRPVPLGPHRVAFLESEIDAWIEGRIAERTSL